MTNLDLEIRERWFDRTITEWTADVIREAERDAVSLHQIISSGREDFLISNSEITEFTKYVLVRLLESGSMPLVVENPGDSWKPTDEYGSSTLDISNEIIRRWQAEGLDPGLDGIWFGHEKRWS